MLSTRIPFHRSMVKFGHWQAGEDLKICLLEWKHCLTRGCKEILPCLAGPQVPAQYLLN